MISMFSLHTASCTQCCYQWLNLRQTSSSSRVSDILARFSFITRPL